MSRPGEVVPIKSLLIPVLLCLALMSTARDLDACTCSGPSAANAQRLADAIYSGRVIRIELRPDSIRPPSDTVRAFQPDALVTLRVIRWWKGGSAPTARVYTISSSSACGYPFEVGDIYLVYSYTNPGGDPETGLCSRTALLNDAGEDLALLGPGERPRTDGPAAPSPGTVAQAMPRSTFVVLAVGAMILGMILGFATGRASAGGRRSS